MKVIKIEVATTGRGFLNELYNHKFKNFEFANYMNNVEITGSNHKLLRNLFYSQLFDKLGIIQVLRKSTKLDVLFSYNRLLKTDKPYILLVENPTALFHYRLGRNKGLFAKWKLKDAINDPKLIAIICISKACASTFNQVLGVNTDKIYQIYPLILDIKRPKLESIRKRLTCLYISSTFELKSGCEITKAAQQLPNVDFIFITRITNIPTETKYTLDKLNNVKLVEFKLSKQELSEYYQDADILLHPTRQDSFALVALEALKNGLPVLATRVYALPEMIIDGYNGFLTEPRYYFFDKHNIPNPEIWNHREQTIYSHYIDENIVSFLVDKIRLLDSDRNLLNQMSNNALKQASSIFGEERICLQWENVINEKIVNILQ